MGALTEPEIFDCLRTNFRLAANLCVELATKPRKGPNYNKLREALKLIEGAARQAAYWRSDARWLQIGLQMAECTPAPANGCAASSSLMDRAARSRQARSIRCS
jgi:hypothetical protein